MEESYIFNQSTMLEDFCDIKEISRSSGGAIYVASLSQTHLKNKKSNSIETSTSSPTPSSSSLSSSLSSLSSKKSYILKERKVSELGKDNDIMNEVNLLSQLNSRNIVKYEVNINIYNKCQSKKFYS